MSQSQTPMLGTLIIGGVTVFEAADEDEGWTMDPGSATQEKGKPKPFDRKGATGTPANCTVTKTAVIPAGGSLIQNHRLASGAGSVPELGDNCFGTLVVTSSDQAIDGFVQLTNYLNPPGDTFMAHTNFAN